MYQLKNPINRSVPSDPSNNVKAAEDFLLLLVHAHIIAAAWVLYTLINPTSVLYLAKSLVATYLRMVSMHMLSIFCLSGSSGLRFTMLSRKVMVVDLYFIGSYF